MKAGAMEANRDQAVGVIGLGNMGSVVAARLVEVGFSGSWV
jgi:3-hydroxyisobutyrate dehydrogenase-like beta-hydroxyacid dehydrogenase